MYRFAGLMTISWNGVKKFRQTTKLVSYQYLFPTEKHGKKLKVELSVVTFF